MRLSIPYDQYDSETKKSISTLKNMSRRMKKVAQSKSKLKFVDTNYGNNYGVIMENLMDNSEPTLLLKGF